MQATHEEITIRLPAWYSPIVGGWLYAMQTDAAAQLSVVDADAVFNAAGGFVLYRTVLLSAG